MNFDKQFIGHLAGELIIIGGVSFWLNKKIGEEAEKNRLLSEEIAKLKEHIAQQNQLLARHENFLQQIAGGMPHQPPPQPQPVQQTAQKIQQAVSQKRPNPPPQPVKKKKPAQTDDSDEDDDPQTDIEVKKKTDELVADELKKIKSSRNRKTA